jgi:hypothetical protein
MNQEKSQPSLTLEDHVLRICELGCIRVNQVIERIEQGQTCEELANVPVEHHHALLIELRSIMAVYDGRDD